MSTKQHSFLGGGGGGLDGVIFLCEQRCHRLTSFLMGDLGIFTKSEQAHVSYQ